LVAVQRLLQDEQMGSGIQCLRCALLAFVGGVERGTLVRSSTRLPEAIDARNMLEHFDEYARGKGLLQRRAIRDEGLSVYEAAAAFWGGGYDPTTDQITEGPIVVDVPTALAASESLQRATYAAGKAVDAHCGGQHSGRAVIQH
jgi:hypothetical protein